MALQQLTQELVNHTANDLMGSNGKRPSNRAVLGAIGFGSMTTLSRLMNIWRDDISSSVPNARPLPARLLRELEHLQRESEKAVRDECDADVTNARDTEQMLRQENEQLLAQVETLSAELQGARENITTADAHVKRLQEDASTREGKLDSANASAGELRIELAKAMQRLDEFMPRLEQDLNECRLQLDIAKKAQTEAEVKAAVAHERASGLDQRLSELKR